MIRPAHRFGRSTRLYTAAIGLCLLPLCLEAQTPAPDSARIRTDTVSPTPPVMVDLTRATLLDTPISRSEYVLGPGDALQLAIFGDFNLLETQTIGPEGTFVIPRMGLLSLLGKTVEEAEREVGEVVARYYRNVSVSINIADVRVFKIFVVGDVDQPGMRSASSVMRVSELVPVRREDGIVHRNIVLRRASGDTLRVDMARFVQTGDLSQNPTLREGDVIVVPSTYETLEVSGPVAYPGAYEFRAGDTLASLLALANGGLPFPANAADSLRLARFDDDSAVVVYEFEREEAAGELGRSLSLHAFDALYLPEVSNFRKQKTALVRGEVRRPGVYPIRPDTTTVRDLVELAGGFTSEASLVTATLRRSSEAQAAGRSSLESIPPELLSDRERRILQSMSSTDQSNVVIDFRQLFAEGQDAYNQTLRSGDELVVPEIRNQVLVSGAVRDPGIVQHVPDRRPAHFIALAGGYVRSADARGAVVLKARSGTRVDWSDVEVIEPGDQIVVPFKTPVTFLDRVQTVQGVFNTVSAIILATVGLSRLF